MVIQISDSEIMNAACEGGVWTEDTQRAWLLEHGVDLDRLVRRWSDPVTRMHFYEVRDAEPQG